VKKTSFLVIVGILGFLQASCKLPDSGSFEEVLYERTHDKELRSAVLGSLIYLNDRQIRDREGVHSSEYDYCDPHSITPTCQSSVSLSLQLLGAEATINNDVGEWANYIHLLPNPIVGGTSAGVFKIQDSNIFTTMSIIFPLFLFDESDIPENERVIAPMLHSAMSSIPKYKRDGSYGFYPRFDDGSENAEFVHAVNISEKFAEKFSTIYVDPNYDWMWKLIAQEGGLPSKDWVQEILDNPYGATAAPNTPSDADDTGVVVAAQKLYSRFYDENALDSYYKDESNFFVDIDSLYELAKYRDMGRNEEDPRNTWREPDSGAFLTWLKDESLDTFSTPNTGVIPHGVNDVDCVVNANAVLAMSMTGHEDVAGFDDAIKLLVDVVANKKWEACGTYYPQKMMLPYVLTRAFRDGGANNPLLRDVMGILVKDILDEQLTLSRTNPFLAGAMPGGEDQSYHLSTALGLNALLNIGRDIAEEAGVLAKYQVGVKKAVEYLLRSKKEALVVNDSTFKSWSKTGQDKGYHWEGGIFFTNSFTKFVQWRSNAYTTAIVLESLSKYLMAYDFDNTTLLEGRRIRMTSYTRDIDRADSGFNFTVTP
jgi:hypothetical protein